MIKSSREDGSELFGVIRRLSEAAQRNNDPLTGGVAQSKILKILTPNMSPEMLKHLGADKAKDAVDSKDEE